MYVLITATSSSRSLQGVVAVDGPGPASRLVKDSLGPQSTEYINNKTLVAPERVIMSVLKAGGNSFIGMPYIG